MDTRLLINFEKIDGAENINVIRRSIPSKSISRIHWHNYYELEILVSGKMRQCINGREYEMTGGNMYLLSFYDYHSYISLEPCELINISFMPDVPDKRISYILEKNGKALVCCFDQEDMQHVLNRICSLEKELKENGYLSEIMLSTLLSEILTFVFRKTSDGSEPVVPLLIQKATGYIHANFRQDISLNSLAQTLSVSSGYLGKALKKNLNKSFNEYLGDIRMKYACNLLDSSQMPISDIASAAGYNSTTYFLYVFKKRFGMTPGEYKKLRDCTEQLYSD